MKQNSYNSDIKGKLYLIPTPIGNLDDITLRALNILKEVDIVFAEDTRETFNLLKYYNINKKIESCHKYSEMKNKEKILKILKEGKTIGFVSDRGTPLISDPGNFVVNEVIKENIPVIALPGATALIPALNMSGLDNERFLFYVVPAGGSRKALPQSAHPYVQALLPASASVQYIVPKSMDNSSYVSFLSYLN